MIFLPIVGRELSVAARRPGTYWMRFWAALIVLAICLLLFSNFRNMPRDMHGQILLHGVGMLALGFSLLAGVFLTADCLSEETREGTLGLLFLTDLRNYDVVLGKMAANSLHAFFGLLATFPILGGTLLLGGVSGWEFARLILVLCVTLFFSLGLGMFISAISQDTRQAMVRTAMLVVVFAGILPALWWAEAVVNHRQPGGVGLLCPSPGYAFYKAFDSGYRIWQGPHNFWLSLGIVFLLGLSGVLAAILLLPRAWRRQDAGPSAQRKPGIRPAAATGAAAAQRSARLNLNPIFWLTAREVATRRFSLRVLAVLLPLWLVFFVETCLLGSRGEVAFLASLLTAFALHQIIKLLIAIEATRRFNLDRQSGALELLLVTPISVNDILAGQMRSLRMHFRTPLILLSLVNIGFCFSLLATPLHGGVLAAFEELSLGGVIVLGADFHALSWVGMWRGLNAAKQHRAILGTLARIQLVQWGVFILLVMTLADGRGESRDLMFAYWVMFCIVTDLVVGLHARARLRCSFRLAAVQRFEGKRA